MAARAHRKPAPPSGPTDGVPQFDAKLVGANTAFSCYVVTRSHRAEVVHIDCTREQEGDWKRLMVGSHVAEYLGGNRFRVLSFVVTVKDGCRAPYGAAIAWEPLERTA